MSKKSVTLDHIDQQLLVALPHTVRPSVTSLARTLGVARGTVQARLQRLEREGAVLGYGPTLDHAAVGLDVLAFVTLAITQGAHDSVVAGLSRMPEVIEVHTVTGAGDLLARVVARSNDHLHEVLQTITAVPEVRRTETQLALSTPLERSILHSVANLGD